MYGDQLEPLLSQDWLIYSSQHQPAKQINKGFSTPTAYMDFKFIVCILSDFENYKAGRQTTWEQNWGKKGVMVVDFKMQTKLHTQ